MKPFSRPLCPEDVGELIDLTVVGDPDTLSMARMQLEGIAALYNILCERPFAYLADEVGMGKTYQALGLAALLWNEQPDARILFISPRQNLQAKWYDDYLRFFASNYRRQQGLGDDRVASVLFGEPIHRPALFHNLREWASTIGMPEPIAPFIRHTSFTRPIHLTSVDLEDLDALWKATERRLRHWGLFRRGRTNDLSPDNASLQLNLAFASALNHKLSEEADGQPYFDLVIIDETQCLRNPWNQTNQVLYTGLRGQVRKWLLMSATPVHGGPGDLPTILNHYLDSGQILAPELVRDLPAMQEALQSFLVRRQRKYRTIPVPAMVGKDQYRNHDPEGWGVRDQEMSALGTLSMALIQKGLVGVLQGKSNRYRIGFLSSFESLQSSIDRTHRPAKESEAQQEPQVAGDWHREQADGLTEAEAPDTHFIQRLNDDFVQSFGFPLPHPKIDAVIDRVAPQAFGTDTEVGGHKYLIFTRRVSTVETLRERLNIRYHQSIEARIRRCWGVELDWSGNGTSQEEFDHTEDPEGFEGSEDESGADPLRKAMSRKGWLFRYRQTFRASGRNALFFEDGWLQRLCTAGGFSPEEAAQRVPDELWAESWTHASRSAGSRSQQYRADRVRYLAVQGIRRYPEVFGLNEQSAAPWREAYEAALHNHLESANPDDDPHPAYELFTTPTLWTLWDERFAETLALPGGDSLVLPGSRPQESIPADELCKRQVARTLLGQNFRLTDTLFDLYFADESAGLGGSTFPERLLDWLASEDPGAQQLRRDCSRWLMHLRLIVDSCLEGVGRPWRELAREESWPQLYNQRAVLGVTGGSRGHQTATQQFRTPSLPRVIVCTDTLKEGVDLHLFCDRVIHYGVAWTSGDLEQRVGRVDRFFSQIERRLSTEGAPPEVQLHVGYPHIVASLERAQVERVIERQKWAEMLMDSPLGGVRHEDKTIVIGANIPRAEERTLGPYRAYQFPEHRRPTMVISEDAARTAMAHYTHWYRLLLDALQAGGWRVSPEDAVPVRVVTVHGKGGQHELEWSFHAALGRYIMTLSKPPASPGSRLPTGRRKRIIGRKHRIDTFLHLLVPTPEEGADAVVISHFVAVLQGEARYLEGKTETGWAIALQAMLEEAQDPAESRLQLTLPCGERHHLITLDARDGWCNITAALAPLEKLIPRVGWDEIPTEKQVQDWAQEATNSLSFGYLNVQEGNLVLGLDILYGNVPERARISLVKEMARLAETWKSLLTEPQA